MLKVHYPKKNPFFREARFQSVDWVASLMGHTGFKQFEFRQTLGQPVLSTEQIEPVEKGYGQGLFTVIKAEKF